MPVFNFPVTIHATASIEGDIEAECWNTVGCDLRDVIADESGATAQTENGATITFTGFEQAAPACAGDAAEHRRCPECGDADHLHGKADVRWDRVAKAWIIAEWIEDGVECTTCDWSGAMEETEYHDDPADEPCPVNRRPKGTCPDGCTHGEV